jgi:hypothetical protein
MSAAERLQLIERAARISAKNAEYRDWQAAEAARSAISKQQLELVELAGEKSGRLVESLLEQKAQLMQSMSAFGHMIQEVQATTQNLQAWAASLKRALYPTASASASVAEAPKSDTAPYSMKF